MSLALASLAAVLVLIVIRVTAPDKPLPEPPDVERLTTYVCPRKHTFRAPLTEEPQVCPVCQVLAYPQAEFKCALHGVFHASLRLNKGDDGLLRVSELKLPGQEWVPVEAGLRCPQCRLKLTRVEPDPMKSRKPTG